MGGQGEDRNRAGLLRRLQLAGGLPPVDAGQAQVHEDDVGHIRLGPGDALLPVDGHDHLVPPPLEPPGQHVPVHLVVLDEQDPRHQIFPRSRHLSKIGFACAWARLTASSALNSPRAAAANIFETMNSLVSSVMAAFVGPGWPTLEVHRSASANSPYFPGGVARVSAPTSAPRSFTA